MLFSNGISIGIYLIRYSKVTSSTRAFPYGLLLSTLIIFPSPEIKESSPLMKESTSGIVGRGLPDYFPFMTLDFCSVINVTIIPVCVSFCFISFVLTVTSTCICIVHLDTVSVKDVTN